MNLFDVSGRVVVVTGANGRLGRQFVASLCQAGAKVAALDLHEGDWSESPGYVMPLIGNVSNRKSLEDCLGRVVKELGQPFGLINNAALDSPPDAPASENGAYEAYPEASFDRVMEVNVKGVHQCCQVFGGSMAQAGGGSIINISSIYGMLSPVQDIYEFRRTGGEEFYKPVAYSVSKSALFNLTRYLATYWAKNGVRVNTLTLAGVFDNQDPRFLEGYLARMPLGRMAQPDEYNGAIQFLLSDASRYMTGANLQVDGGWSAW
jgi:NAD(P)-dependent dehydrogenase (short-subunit alcohol dehydrogenase family)